MTNNDKAVPSFSDQTFKVMEVDGKEEIFVSDIHSDQWNDGQTEFGVKKINQLVNTTNEVVDKTIKLETTSKEQANSITELEKINKEQTDSINELEKISKDQTGSINELMKKIAQLEEDSKKVPYYEGEYKWMPTTTTTMPAGWKKVSMTSGFTIVANSSEGTKSGEVKSHKHDASSSTSFPGYIPYSPDNRIESLTVWGGWNYTDRVCPVNRTNNSWNYISSISATTSVSTYGDTNNLAAGISGTLWQYDPTGKFTALREAAIKSQKLKEELGKEQKIEELNS